MADRDFLMKLQTSLADEGKLIEAGWVSLRLLAVPPDAGPSQLNAMRMAFMCGAEHLFRSLQGVLDPGEDMTDRDMERMQKIDDELAAFRAELEKQFTGARTQ